MLKFLCSLSIIMIMLSVSYAEAKEIRTTNRTVTGDSSILTPSFFPLHLAPSTKKSYENWDSNPKTDPQFYKYRHPQQWMGMAWDTITWPEGVTEETVLQAMYHFGIFKKQYVSKRQQPVVEIGSGFYKLSDLDRRRSLKLIADYFEFFENGFVSFEVRDWRRSVKIGDYNRYGFQPE